MFSSARWHCAECKKRNNLGVRASAMLALIRGPSNEISLIDDSN